MDFVPLMQFLQKLMLEEGVVWEVDKDVEEQPDPFMSAACLMRSYWLGHHWLKLGLRHRNG